MKNICIVFFSFFLTTSLSAQWTQVSAPPEGFRTDHTFGFAINGTGYLVTGKTPNGITASVYSYSPDLDEWTQLPDFPGGTRGFAIGDVWEDKAYFGFGRGISPDSTEEAQKNDLWSYDPSTEQWTELASCPCTPRIHPAFVAHQGNIYVGMGSTTGIGNLNDWWQYNIATDTWTQKPDLPGPTRHHPYQFAVGDYVYAGFGHGSEEPKIYKTWFRFDPTDDTWTQVADIPDQGRVAGTQFSHNGYGYVLSGDGEDHDSMETGEFWRYDADSNQWTQLLPHPGASRWAPASFILDNEVYVINGSSFGNYDVEAYKYDLGEPTTPLSDPWTGATVRLYPNPFSGQFNIQVEGEGTLPGTPVHFSMYDMLGHLVHRSVLDPQLTQPDLRHLRDGHYFGVLSSDQSILTSRIITKKSE